MALGTLSAKYESNGDPGAVSTGWGDAGGISYGTYQLSSNKGSAKNFVYWLKSQGYSCGDILIKNEPGSEEFSADWKYCAENFDDFGDLQHDYIAYAYYEPAIERLHEAGFNIENHHEVIQDVVFSRAVQYGTGNIVEMFEDACKSLGYDNLSYVDAPDFDADMIRTIYLVVCRSEEWAGESSSLREGLYARFENECADALKLLKRTDEVAVKKMAKYFSEDELRCKCCNQLPKLGIDEKLLELLDAIREKVGKPVYLSCAYRCSSHNEEVGGVPNSFHVQGNAADILLPDGWTVDELAEVVKDCGADGVGRYYDSEFVHVDTRGYEASWIE